MSGHLRFLDALGPYRIVYSEERMWEVWRGDKFMSGYYVGEQDARFAVRCYREDEMQRAAPEMLGALMLLHKWFEITGSSVRSRWERIPPEERLAIVKAARAAIETAKGEKP